MRQRGMRMALSRGCLTQQDGRPDSGCMLLPMRQEERMAMEAEERARLEALKAAERAQRERVAAALYAELAQLVTAEASEVVARDAMATRRKQEADLAAALRLVDKVEQEMSRR